MREKVDASGKIFSVIEINCDICMDLLPLVQDGIASENSRRAVEEHVKNCPNCKAYYSGETVPTVDAGKLWTKVMRKVRITFAAFLLFGIFFGLSLTASQDMFYNSLLMPLVGVVGYVVFRWHALYVVPGLMLVTNCLSGLLGMLRGVEYLDFASGVMWVAIYSIFVATGIIIAGLLHFAFRREADEK